MKLADLNPKVIQAIKERRFDWFVEKHEGPWLWKDFLKHCEIIRIKDHDILLPVFKDHHQNVRVIRFLESRDGQSLTLLLKDTTCLADPKRKWAEAGYMAVLLQVRGRKFLHRHSLPSMLSR